ncbi:MAG TPA: class I SAM-dependent methyltransferase [Vicinamibacterales bacterium]|nr:class I SAM-dependent methyltransferase [Vicinamibacterales bacterium]
MRALQRLMLWRLGRIAITPWAGAGETECLIGHARNKRRLAEIGVWEGGTTKLLRQVMAPDGVLFAIDPFPGGSLGLSYQRPIAHGEVRRIRNGRVVWLRATGRQAASDPRVTAAPFDFIFIDSDHTFDGLQADWEAWAPRASDIIALHDVVGDLGQGSVRFARERIFTDPRFAVLNTVGCLAVLRRVRAYTA